MCSEVGTTARAQRGYPSGIVACRRSKLEGRSVGIGPHGL